MAFQTDALDIIAFIMAIIYTLVPIAFFCQYSAGVVKKEICSIFGILFLYLNGLTYFIATIANKIKKYREIEMRDFSNLSGAILGFGFSLYYIYIMFFKEQRKKFWVYLCIIIAMIPILILLACLILSFNDNADILEYIGVPFNIFEYLPLGFDLYYLIRHKISVKFILFSAIPGIINTTIWLVWACIKTGEGEEKKYHSLVANILGFLICLAQFIIFFFGKKDEELSDNLVDIKEIKEVDESEIKKEEKKTEYDDIL